MATRQQQSMIWFNFKMSLVFSAISILVLLCCKGQCSSEELFSPDIYWREYKNVIPGDAVPGGNDKNNKPTYIGQGYVKDLGIIPGMIYSAVNYINVPGFGTKNITGPIKILCSSNQNRLSWIPVSAHNFHLATIKKYVVRGGEETGHVVYIGRIIHDGELVTGKIITGPFESPGYAPMYYAYGNIEFKADSYDVLVHSTVSLSQEDPIAY